MASTTNCGRNSRGEQQGEAVRFGDGCTMLLQQQAAFVAILLLMLMLLTCSYLCR
jgi:hypothetical protein